MQLCNRKHSDYRSHLCGACSTLVGSDCIIEPFPLQSPSRRVSNAVWPETESRQASSQSQVGNRASDWSEMCRILASDWSEMCNILAKTRSCNPLPSPWHIVSHCTALQSMVWSTFYESWVQSPLVMNKDHRISERNEVSALGLIARKLFEQRKLHFLQCTASK